MPVCGDGERPTAHRRRRRDRDRQDRARDPAGGGDRRRGPAGDRDLGRLAPGLPGLDIGTAKVSAADRARVPHAGLDLVDPDRALRAVRFRRSTPGRPGARSPPGTAWRCWSAGPGCTCGRSPAASTSTPCPTIRRSAPARGGVRGRGPRTPLAARLRAIAPTLAAEVGPRQPAPRGSGRSRSPSSGATGHAAAARLRRPVGLDRAGYRARRERRWIATRAERSSTRASSRRPSGSANASTRRYRRSRLSATAKPGRWPTATPAGSRPSNRMRAATQSRSRTRHVRHHPDPFEGPAERDVIPPLRWLMRRPVRRPWRSRPSGRRSASRDA